MRHRHAAAFVVVAALAMLPLVAFGQGKSSADLLKDGRTQWLRYDSRANQITGCPDVAWSIDSAGFYQPDPRFEGVQYPPFVAMQRLHTAVVGCPRANADVGSAEYQQAEQYFRQAFNATPADPRAFRNLAMLLADHARWNELMAVGREQTRRDKSDPWGFLSIALALHRGGKSDLASAVFDTATNLMAPAERGRLFMFARLLDRPDSAAYAKSPPATQAAQEKRFWLAADPLWSRKSGDPKSEFLARVTYAELRWTVEEQKARGADSDRGETYVRFGPPDRVLAMRGSEMIGATNPGRQQLAGQKDQNTADAIMNGKNIAKSGQMTPQPSDIVTWWDYDNGLTLVFWGAPTYGTAKFPTVDQRYVSEIVEARSTAFDNVSNGRIVALGTQVVRFRAPNDSVDVLVIAQAPMAAVRSATTNAAVNAQFWLTNPDASVRESDSVTLRQSGIEQHLFRVPPARYGFRVEATSEGSTTAARALGLVTAGPDTTGFALRGFAISDLLLGVVARARANPPAHWSDFDIAPLLGQLPRGQNLEIIWENYELGSKNEQSQYQVTVTLSRVRGPAGRVVAALAGFAANAVGIDRKDDRVTFKFDRGVAPAPVVTDHISIVMGETPPGDYLLKLEVSDKATGRKTARTIPVSIAQ